MSRAALTLGLVALTVYVLIVARALLLPLVFAFGFWYLINTLAKRYAKIKIFGRPAPGFFCFLAAILTMGAAVWFVVDLILANIAEVAKLAPTYQANLERQVEALVILLHLEQTPTIQEIANYLDITKVLTGLARTFTGIAGTLLIVLVYLAFMLYEQTHFDQKLDRMIDDEKTEKKVREVLGNIDVKIQKYLWVKTIMSALTGACSYVVMWHFGVDFAEFWALIIFFLNYIPTIGSLLGIIFPAVLTLFQFEGVSTFTTLASFFDSTFFKVGLGLGAVQMVIGNFLDPRMMGESLNLSPLVIILSLALWGTIWGFPGMFLAVPIMVILAIILAQFPQTRSIAVMLSKNGQIDGVTPH